MLPKDCCNPGESQPLTNVVSGREMRAFNPSVKLSPHRETSARDAVDTVNPATSGHDLDSTITVVNIFENLNNLQKFFE